MTDLQSDTLQLSRKLYLPVSKREDEWKISKIMDPLILDTGKAMMNKTFFEEENISISVMLLFIAELHQT